MKLSCIVATSTIAAAAFLAEQADAHAFLMKPAIQLTTNEKNMYAYVVPGEKAPPFSAYTTGNAEKNSQGFVTNYKKLNPASLKSFIMANQVRATSGVPAGGTAECGYSKMDQPALPLPDQIEFGNYQLSNREGIHPGPCEAWCDDDIVVPFTMDCRTILNKPITYDKAKCAGKKRLTFYWLATHFAPFQVYIGCAPLSGGGAGSATSGQAGNRNAGSSGAGAAATPAAGGSTGGNAGGANTAFNAGGNTGGNNGANSGANNNNNNSGGNNNNNGANNGGSNGNNNQNRNTGNNNGSSNNNNGANNNNNNKNNGGNTGNNNGGNNGNNANNNGGNTGSNNNNNNGGANNQNRNVGNANNGGNNNNNNSNNGRSRSLDFDFFSGNSSVGVVSPPQY